MHQSIYSMNEQALSLMLTQHLGTRPVQSEFSSWAAAMRVALNIGYHGGTKQWDEATKTYKEVPHYLAVVDTHRLKSHDYGVPPEIFHVPQLWRADLAPWTYAHEYLIHGEVSGRGSDYFTMALTPGCKAEIDQIKAPLPKKTKGVDPFVNIEEDTKQAMKVAEPFLTQRNTGSGIDGGVYIYTVAMLIAMRFANQSVSDFETQMPRIVETITSDDRVGRDSEILRLRKSWGKDECVMHDLVYTQGYIEIKLAIRVLRYMALQPNGEAMIGQWGG